MQLTLLHNTSIRLSVHRFSKFLRADQNQLHCLIGSFLSSTVILMTKEAFSSNFSMHSRETIGVHSLPALRNRL